MLEAETDARQLYFSIGSPAHGAVAATAEAERVGAASESTGLDRWVMTLSYTPDLQYVDGDSFTFQACEPTGQCDDGRVTIIVASSNQAPVAVDDAATVDEGLAVVTVDLTANDVDPEGDALMVLSVSNGANGTVINNGDGTVTYTHDGTETTTDRFTYTISDSHGATAVAAVNIVVTAVNDPPVAVDDSGFGFIAVENTVVTTGNVTANDSDVDDPVDATSVTVITNVTNGVLVNNADGTFDYTPNPNFNGTDSFTYTINDGTTPSNDATVTITVTAVNDAPVATDDGGVAYTTSEDTPFTTGDVTANDSDVDDPVDPTTVTVITNVSNGVLTNNADGTFDYTANPNYNGTDTFTYTINDGTTPSNAATVTLNVTAGNEPPIAANNGGVGYTTSEDTPFTTGDVTANDSDVDDPVDPSSVTVISNVTNGVLLNNADGTFDYTPNPNYNDTDTFTYTINDGTTPSNIATVTITVTTVNDPPVAVNDSGFGFIAVENTIVTTGNVTANDSDVDDPVDPTSVTVITNVTNGALVNNADGTFDYTPNPNYNGTDSFTYTISDGTTPSNDATVTITVTAVNDAPVVINDGGVGYTTSEDTPFTTGNVTTNDTDVDDSVDPTSVTVISNVTNGVLTNNADGTFDYTPNPNYNGTDIFTYTISDGTVASNIATVTITIAPVNDEPVAINDGGVGYTTSEDTPFTTGNVTTNDSDVDDPVDPTTVTVITNVSNGVLTNNADGTFDYTPNPNYNGTDTFTYTINDGTVASNIATVTITIAPVNDAPIAINDGYTTSEDAAFTTGNVATNDGDLEDGVADASTGAVVDDVSNGVLLDNADGTFDYTPNPNYAGIDSFSYTIYDSGLLLSNIATVTITIAPVNDAPIAANDGGGGLSTPEDTPFTTADVTTNDTDVDDPVDPTSVTVITNVTNGVLVNNANGTFDYTPNPNYNGTDTFTYTISDSNVTSNIATVTITIAPVNDAPVAVDDGGVGYTTAEDAAFTTADVTANDTDFDDPVDPTSVTVITNVTNGVLTNNADGTLDYTPNPNYNGTDTFSYTISDGTVASNIATVTLNVTAGNDPPSAANDGGVSFSTPEDTPFTTGNVTTNDGDLEDGVADPTTVTVISNVTNGVLVNNGDGTFDYTPNPDYAGTDTFTYTIYDSGLLLSNIATVTITIAPVNDEPVAINDGGVGYTTSEDAAFTTGDVTANDTDLDDPVDPTSVTVITNVTNGVLTNNADGTFDYTPNPNYDGVDSFTYTINDGTTPSNAATVTITVTAVNDAPVTINDGGVGYTTEEDTPFTTGNVTTNDTDVDDPVDPISATVITNVTNGVLTNNADGTFDYTPNPSYNGVDSFTYTINDGTTPSNAATVTIAVTAVNDAPLATNDSGVGYTTSEDAAFTTGNVTTNDTDVDDPVDPTSVTVITNVTNGVLTNNADGTFDYTPNPSYNGTDSFTYTINDGTTPSNAATVTIAVTAVNNAPVAINDGGVGYTTEEDTPFTTGNVTTNDTDVDDPVDPTSVTVITNVTNGVLVNNGDGTFGYTPNPNYNGVDSFTYTINDGTTPSNDATVTITVTAVNNSPTAFDDSITVDEGLNVLTVDLTANDTDADGPVPLYIESTTNGTNGTVNDNGDGTVTYTHDGTETITDSFTYTVSDSVDTDVATVVVTINPLNDPPAVVDPGAQSATVGTPFSRQIDATDPEGDGLTYVAGGLPPGLTIDGAGLISGVPDPGTEGAYSVDVDVIDDGSPNESISVTFALDVVAAPIGGVVISEYSNVGGGGNDFIELYNASDIPVDIEGWTLELADDTTIVDTHPLTGPNTLLPPGGHYLLTEGSGDQSLSSLTASLGIRLRNGATIIDVVGNRARPWGTVIPASLWAEGTGVAPLLDQPGYDQSWERRNGGVYGNCQDTDDNSADFIHNFTTAQVNAQSSSDPATPCSTPTPPTPPAHLVISEYRTQGPPPIAGDNEFVEIFNPTAAPISLAGYELRRNSETRYVFPAFVLQPGQYFLVAGTGYVGPRDGTHSNFGLGDDVLLYDTTTSSVIDELQVDNGPPSVPILDGTMNPTYERKFGGCQDTDVAIDDFVHQLIPTPTTSSDPTAICA